MIASSQNIPIKRGIKRVNERETKRQQRERKEVKGREIEFIIHAWLNSTHKHNFTVLCPSATITN